MKRRDREWWRLLGCGLPWFPVLLVAAPLFVLACWLCADGLTRRSA